MSPKELKNVLETSESAIAGTSEPLDPVSVVDFSLLGVPEHLVGFGRFFEALFRLLVAGVSVRMILQCLRAVGPS